MANIGAGTSFSHCSTSNGTFTNFAKMTSFKPGKVDIAEVPVETFDAQTLGSTGLPISDNLPGWVKEDPWSLTLLSTPANIASYRALLGVNPHFFKVIKSDGSGYTFQGWMKNAGEDIPLKELVSCTFNINVNGGSISTFSATQS